MTSENSPGKLHRSLALQVLVNCVQQRINGPFLNMVRRIPVKPAIVIVLCDHNPNWARQMPQENQEPFFNQTFATIAFLIHHVAIFVLKIRVNFDRIGRNARFLVQLTQRTLDLRLALVQMPFRQVPATRMSHQQERIHRLATQDQETTGKRLLHVIGLHETATTGCGCDGKPVCGLRNRALCAW